MFLRNLALATLTLSLAACAGAGRVYQADSVKPVRNVAIVGIDVVQPAEFDPFKPNAKVGGDTPMANMNFALAKPSEHVAEFYNDLKNSMKNRYRWNITAAERMIGNSVYKRYHHDTTTGFQSTTPIPNGKAKFSAPGMLDFDGAKKIGLAGRDALIDALKVDAVVLAQYTIDLSGTTVMGIGSRYPQTSLRFAMYRKGQEAPVWQDTVSGEKMSESIGKTAISLNFAKMQELSLKSAKKAYAELDTRTTLPQ